MKKLTIATRGSQLALWQSNYIKSVLEAQNPDLEVELKVIITTGDRILDKALSQIGGKGLFLKELEEAMQRGEAQIAVHSLKDVPTELPDGFVLGAITEREDARDALLSEKYENIDALPKGAIVGTSSLRRRMQIEALRPDLIIKDLRGNVDTRIKKLQNGDFDAIILASAGINRLGFGDSVKYIYNISLAEMIPSMGQGALGIEAVNDPEVVAMVARLQDDATMIATTIERDFVDSLDGGCQVPIGVNAVVNGDDVSIEVILGLPDGSEILRESTIAKTSDYKTIGRIMGQDMIAKGAKELLHRAEVMAAATPSTL
ncbi:MAG: hydroxymethylbilane synthase [Thiovulaceae bacterium]|nr:hydroxymethylbilane synthase [Sulfurimonadaceae bacterium]